MPEGPGLTYRLGRGEVALRPDGSVASVVPGPGAASHLVGGGRVRAWLGGHEVSWTASEVEADVDEVEFRFTGAAGLGLVVRHSFAGGWAVRIAFANQTSVRLTAAELGWVPAPDRPVRALAAGATGAYAVPGPHGEGPLLGGELELGTCDLVTAQGIGLGRLELEPGQRRVVQWRWDWYADPRSFDRPRFAAVPLHLVMPEGENALIAADDDQAVEAYAVDVERRGGQLELAALGAAGETVRVSSHRGVTSYPLQWVEPLDQVLAELVDRVLDGPRTPAGVVRLPDLDAALAVQHVLARGQAADPEVAEDALGLFVSRLADGDVVDGRGVGLLCGELGRTGDEAALDRATRALLARTRPAPGLGLAATQVCLARMAAGQPVDAVLAHLTHLAGLTAGLEAPTDLDTAIALELRLTSAPRSRHGDHDADHRAVEPAVRRLGSVLGAGLRGQPVRPGPVDEQAYVATVLGLLPEDAQAQWSAEWGVRPHDVARVAQAEVLARADRRAPGAAYGWLVLGARVA